MKKIVLVFIAIIILDNSNLFSQVSNHPTIDKVKVGYKAIAGTPTNTNGKPNIMVLPEATINLKSLSGVSKIYMKILNRSDNNLVYQINYSVMSSPVTNSQGVKLFYRDNLIIHIGSPDIVSLNQYLYEVVTEDSQSNQTIVYSIIQ
jgi:hypothetical protein